MAIVLFCAIGIVLVCLAIPLIRRRIQPNWLYGLRTPATFADDTVWYEANARSGRDLTALGCLQIVVAVALVRLPAIAYVLANAAFLTAGCIALAIIGWRRANALLAAQRSHSRHR